jgi:hypothetical protein
MPHHRRTRLSDPLRRRSGVESAKEHAHCRVLDAHHAAAVALRVDGAAVAEDEEAPVPDQSG